MKRIESEFGTAFNLTATHSLHYVNGIPDGRHSDGALFVNKKVTKTFD